MSQYASLIPRTDLLAPGTRSAPSLSPNGARFAFVAPYNGIQNIWLAPAYDPDAARPITREEQSTIRGIFWSGKGDRLIVLQDRIGSEETNIQAFDPDTGSWTMLSPSQKGETRVAAISTIHPDRIALEINDRNPAYFDLWSVDIYTGAANRVFENNRFTWMHVDHELRLRLAELRRDDGAVDYCVPSPDDRGEWYPLIHVPFDDEAVTRPFRIYETPTAFGQDDKVIYAMDSRDGDTAALATWDLETGKREVLAHHELADASLIYLDTPSGTPLAWQYAYDKPEVLALSSDAESDFRIIRERLGATFSIADQSANSRVWIIVRDEPHRPPEYWLFDRDTKEQLFLYSLLPALDPEQMCKSESHIINARDGRKLVCYLTRAGHAPAPMVMLLHGGPWIRDEFGFDPWVQFLADRGYHVLRVNFRGSRGFGKSHLNAGDREWGGKMFDDVVDAAEWAIANGVTARDTIGLMGASFGGYSVLVGMTREPKRFACGIDMFGVSDLESFLRTIPSYWKSYRNMWDRRLGNIDDPSDLQMIRERSPLNHVDQIVRPLMIAQGGADPRVVKAESDQMAGALDARGAEVAYLLFEDEGHSFYQLDNQLSFFACVEAFLAKHLGGRTEPFGDEIPRSSMEVPVGLGRVPGLADAMRADPSE